MVTFTIPSWDAFFFLVFEVIFFGCCCMVRIPSKPRGPLDDPAFAAALEQVEREAIAADEAEYARRRRQQMEQGFRAMREIDAVAAYAWWAREPDDEEEAPA